MNKLQDCHREASASSEESLLAVANNTDCTTESSNIVEDEDSDAQTSPTQHVACEQDVTSPPTSPQAPDQIAVENSETTSLEPPHPPQSEDLDEESQHDHKIEEPPSESANNISDSDGTQNAAADNAEAPLLREFLREIDGVHYVFKEMKKNRGKLYKIKKNGKPNKKKSGTFKFKNGEMSIKWATS